MADEIWVVELDTSAVTSSATSAIGPVARLEAELDGLRDVQGRTGAAMQGFGSTLAGQSTHYAGLSSAGQQLIRTKGELGFAAGRTGQSLMTFARTMDDAKQFSHGLQPGLQAIGNNLVEINPLLGLAAIGLGILAARFGDIQAAVQGTSLEGPLKTWKDFFDQNIQAAGEFVGILDSADKKAARSQTAQASKATAEIGKIKNPEEEAAGKAVTNVIKRFGGGEETLALLVKADLAATTAKPRKQDDQRAFEEKLALDLQSATQGDAEAIDRIKKVASSSDNVFVDRMVHAWSDERRRERVAPVGKASLFGQELGGEIGATTPEATAAARDEKERIDRESKEAEEASKARQKVIDDTAKTLAEGSLGTTALGGELITASDVQEQLGVAGTEVSLEYAEEIRQKLVGMIDTLGSERALKEGIPLEEAQTKIRDERLAKGKEEEEKKALDAAKEQGADLFADAAARGGADAKRISQLLQARGLDKVTADSLAETADTGARRDRFGKLLEGEKPRSSEVLSGTGLVDAIQKGVGGEGDVAQKQLKEQQRTNLILERLSQQPVGRGGVRLRPI